MTKKTPTSATKPSKATPLTRAATPARPARAPKAAAPSKGDVPLAEPAEVDAFIRAQAAPLGKIVAALRKIILDVDDSIAEHIKWNHPAYFYTGPMPPFDAKEYRRHMIVFNLHSKEGGVLLVFPRGADVDDGSGFLTGSYPDGRRLARFHALSDVKDGEKALRGVIARWLLRARAEA